MPELKLRLPRSLVADRPDFAGRLLIDGCTVPTIRSTGRKARLRAAAARAAVRRERAADQVLGAEANRLAGAGRDWPVSRGRES